MKKLFKNIANTAKTTAASYKSSIAAFHSRAVSGNAGEGYIDTAVKVLIAVVLGALVLAGLYAVLDDTVMPTVTQRIRRCSTTRADALGTGTGLLRRSHLCRRG